MGRRLRKGANSGDRTGLHIQHPNYYPNSIENAPRPDPSYAEPSWHLGDVTVERYNSREGHDDYTQAGDLFRLMGEVEKERLAKAIASALGGCRREIIERQLPHFYRADEDYGRRVSSALDRDVRSDAELAVRDDVAAEEAVRA